MLAMADRKGRVFGSIPGLANIARISTEACREAIHAFLSPDPDSRTKDFEGRRVAEIDGGWLLLNYEKHRAMIDEESVKESKRNWARKHRAEQRGEETYPQADVEVSRKSRHRSTQAEAEAEGERSKDNPPTPLPGGAPVDNFKPRKRLDEPSEGFTRFWDAWPAHKRKVARQQCWDKWRAKGCEEHLDTILQSVEAAKRSEDWRKSGGEYIPAPIVWLNQQRWEAPLEAVENAPNLTVPGESTEAYLERMAQERAERARGCVKPPSDILALVRRAVKPLAP